MGIALLGCLVVWTASSDEHWYLKTAKLWSSLAFAASAGFCFGIKLEGPPIIGLLAIGAWMIALPGLCVSIVGAMLNMRHLSRCQWLAVAGMVICLVANGAAAWWFLQNVGGASA